MPSWPSHEPVSSNADDHRCPVSVLSCCQQSHVMSVYTPGALRWLSIRTDPSLTLTLTGRPHSRPDGVSETYKVRRPTTTCLNDEQPADERTRLEVPDLDQTVLTSGVDCVSTHGERKHGTSAAVKRME